MGQRLNNDGYLLLSVATLLKVRNLNVSKLQGLILPPYRSQSRLPCPRYIIMSSTQQEKVIEFDSGGFHLFVPPLPFACKRPRFIMLDDSKQVFYDVDYETPALGNHTPWEKLDLHTKREPAIVFTPFHYYAFMKRDFATGSLVSIESREDNVYVAKWLGAVNVSPMKQDQMNWAMLRSWKGEELPNEMQNGLLRHVWNRRSKAESNNIPYVTQASVLDQMPRPWHNNGEYLSYELDQTFAGGLPIGSDQLWRIHI